MTKYDGLGMYFAFCIQLNVLIDQLSLPAFLAGRGEEHGEIQICPQPQDWATRGRDTTEGE